MAGLSASRAVWATAALYHPLRNIVLTSTPQLTGFPFPGPTIIDRLESAGKTWKAYMDDYPTTCAYPSSPANCSSGNCYVGYGGTSNNYDNEHDPFVYFADISTNANRCSMIVQANSGGNGLPDNNLLSDLSSTSKGSNLMWLTPNLCNDGHDKCLPLRQRDNTTEPVPIPASPADPQ